MTDPSNSPSLTVLAGALAGQRYDFDPVDNVLIGSDPSCPFCIDAPGVSPIHARVWVDAEGATVFDTKSPAGVYVNDDRVNEKALLRHGDILWLGPPGEPESVMIQATLPPSEQAVVLPPSAEAIEADADYSEDAFPIDQAPVSFEEAPEVFEAAAAAVPAQAEASEEAFQIDETLALAAAPVEAPASFEEAPEVFEAAAAAVPAEAEASEEAFQIDETLALAAAPAEAPVTFEEAPEVFEAAEAAVPAEAEASEEAFQIDETLALAAPVAEASGAVATEVDSEPAFFTEEKSAPGPGAKPGPAIGDEVESVQSVEEFVVDELPQAEPAPHVAPPLADVPPAPPAARLAASPVAAAAPADFDVEAARKAVPPASHRLPAARAAGTRRPASTGSSTGVYVGIGVAVLLVGGAVAAFLLRTPAVEAPSSAVATTTLPPPETIPPEPLTEPTPPPSVPVEEIVAVTTPSPVATRAPAPATTTPAPAPPRPVPTPTARPVVSPPVAASAAPTPPPQPSQAQVAQQRASQIAGLLGQADAALAARRPEQAAGLFEEVLKLEPQNPKAVAGKATAASDLGSLEKEFAVGRTSFSGKAKKGASGFADNEQADPEYQGRVDFEFSPQHVKPGDALGVKVFLVNEGQKAIKASGMTLTTIANGQRTAGTPKPLAKEVSPGQRVLLGEAQHPWQEGTNAWTLDVVVTSARGETYASRVTWR